MVTFNYLEFVELKPTFLSSETFSGIFSLSLLGLVFKILTKYFILPRTNLQKILKLSLDQAIATLILPNQSKVKDVCQG